MNWFVIIPALCVALLFLKWSAFFVELAAKISPQDGDRLFIAFVALGIASLLFALRFKTRNRPTRGSYRAGRRVFLWNDLVPAICSVIFFTLLVALARFQNLIHALPCCSSATDLASHACLGWLAIIGGAVGAVVYVVAWAIACPRFRTKCDFWGDLGAWSFARIIYGALMGVGLWFYAPQYSQPFWIYESSEIILIVFVVPWGLASQLFAEMIFVGLTSSEKDSDSDREWLGRAAGWYLIAAALWLILMVLVFVGSNLAIALFTQVKAWLAPLGVSGVVTAILEKSSWTQAKGKATGGAAISANVILAVAAPIFAVTLIIVLSALLDEVAFGTSLTDTVFWRAPVVAPDGFLHWPTEGWWLLVWTIIIAAVAVAAGIFINVNRFSLHALYRNRIIRFFLGGANPQRNPNPFTDFDEGDNLRMYSLWPRQGTTDVRTKVRSVSWLPFHIINMALNITSTQKLAWQQRKADSFTVTPLHSGSSSLNRDANDVARGGFRDSHTYGDERGISLIESINEDTKL